MRLSTLFIACAVVFSGPAALQAQEKTPQATIVGDKLAKVCDRITDTQGSLAPALVQACLDTIKTETRIIAEAMKAQYKNGADSFKQNSFIAGLAADRLARNCGGIAGTYNPRNEQEAIMQVTADALHCLNGVKETGTLSEIKVNYDPTWHAVLATTTLCVRGYVEAESSALCVKPVNP